MNYGVWQIPEATLSFPPHRLLHRLGTEDKVEVVVFFLDDLANPQKPEFKLLFEGEIIGWSYTSSPHGRQMSFNAIADISIFTQLYYFFLNNVDAVTDYVVDQGNPASGVSQPGAFYPFSLFKKGLILTAPNKQGDPSQPDVTRPFDIIYNAVSGMVDSRLPAGRRAIPSVNFFARWVRKRNFLNRFCALPLFEDNLSNPEAGVFPILQSAQATTALQALQTSMSQGIGNAGTIWEVLKEVYGHVHFEIAMLPTAPCSRVRLSYYPAPNQLAPDGTILGPATTRDGTIPAEQKNTEPLRLQNYFVKPQFFFGIPPTCNVMFPSMISSYSYSESYVAQPTRTYVNDQFITGVMPTNAFVTSALTFGYPPEVDATLRAKMGEAEALKDPKKRAARMPQFSGKNMLVFPEEFFKGPVLHRMPVPPWFTHLKNTAPQTKQTASTQADPAAEKENKSLHELMQGYVEYEHYRARYEKRGGAVNMAWNPYVIPGFPCVVFDQKASAFHTIGYLSNVVQSLSLDGMSTSINYSLSRTIPEMLDLLNQEVTKTKTVYGSAPLEPVNSIRDIIQDFTKAEQFYNALLFQRQELTNGKKASFDFREVIGYARTDGKVDRIQLETTEETTTVTTVGGSSVNVNAAPDQSTNPAGATGVNTTSTTTTTTVLKNSLTGTRDIVPLPGFVPVFNQYNTAMQYVARPICTLHEYVRFLHGGKDIDDPSLTEAGVDGYPQVELGDAKFGPNVEYFKRIRRLIQGPGETPSAAETGVRTDPVSGAVVYEGKPIGAENAAQTRADWDSALVAYRSQMYDRKGPHE